MYVALSHGPQKLGFENAAESFHAVRNEKKISCDISFFFKYVKNHSYNLNISFWFLDGVVSFCYIIMETQNKRQN